MKSIDQLNSNLNLIEVTNSPDAIYRRCCITYIPSLSLSSFICINQLANEYVSYTLFRVRVNDKCARVCIVQWQLEADSHGLVPRV